MMIQESFLDRIQLQPPVSAELPVKPAKNLLNRGQLLSAILRFTVEPQRTLAIVDRFNQEGLDPGVRDGVDILRLELLGLARKGEIELKGDWSFHAAGRNTRQLLLWPDLVPSDLWTPEKRQGVADWLHEIKQLQGHCYWS